MSTRSINRFDTEVEQIESIAETKGIDIEDIDVMQSETDTGDELVTFRIYETKADTEADSVGVQVSKMPSVETGDMTFRNDVQNKLSSLKNYLSGEMPSERVQDDADESDGTNTESDTDATERPERGSESDTTDTRTYNADGPGSELDMELQMLRDRVSDLEAQLESYEETLKAMQQLTGNTDD